MDSDRMSWMLLENNDIVAIIFLQKGTESTAMITQNDMA